MYRYIKANRTDDYINEYYDDLYGDDFDKDVVEEEVPDWDDLYDDGPTPEEEQRLRDFYNTHIKGKTDYGIDTYAVYSLAHELWRTLDTKEKYTYIYDFMNSPEFVEIASEKFGASPEHLRAAMDYAEAKGTYSDWHKDLYGFRPRG